MDNAFLNMDMLRFTTAGSVDDGKSTLIGRLLFDSKAIFEDQLEAIEQTSKMKGEEQINLALLTDGLRAEREQGITIDVAYRYFATPKRKFIIADTPGHIQYTRNMVTGASTANLALILIDARNGVSEQTIRHSYISSILGIKSVVVCINKMDLVNYSKEVFENIKSEFNQLSKKMNFNNIIFIPICAKWGDNVVLPSNNMSWYTGKTLVEHLETVDVFIDQKEKPARFPIQYVIRPNNDFMHDFRGYAGRVASGVFNEGDAVTILPSGFQTKIKEIIKNNQNVDSCSYNESVCVTLKDDIDISRGNIIVKNPETITSSREFEAAICWFNQKPLIIEGKYILRLNTNELRIIVKDSIYKKNINTLENIYYDKVFKMNDIGNIIVKTTAPCFFEPYSINKVTGSFILIDEATNETVAAGMIE